MNDIVKMNELPDVVWLGVSDAGDWGSQGVWGGRKDDVCEIPAIPLDALEAYVREETGYMGDDFSEVYDTALADLLAHFKKAAGQEES